MGWLVKADKPDFIGRDAIAGRRGARAAPGARPGFEIVGHRRAGRGRRRSCATARAPIGRDHEREMEPTLDRGDRARLAGRGRRDRGQRAITIRLGVGKRRRARRSAGCGPKPFYDPTGERLRA